MQRRPILLVFMVSVITALSTSVGNYFALRHYLSPTADEVFIPPQDLALMPRVVHEESADDEPGLFFQQPTALPVSFESLSFERDTKSEPVEVPSESVPAELPVTPENQISPLNVNGSAALESAMTQIRSAQAVILNNIANANTVGFKKSRILFEELGQRTLTSPGQLDSQGRPTPLGISYGGGVRTSARQTDYSQGALRSTGRRLDLAIEGDGFFMVNDGNRFFYTRVGSFAFNANGEIVLASADRGRPLEPNISIPIDTTGITINSEGFVYVEQPGQQNLNQIGQIQLARFINPQGLISVGENLYVNSDASGTALISTPGQDGLGHLRQHFLEESNVDLPAELAELRKLQQQLDALQKYGETTSGRQ